MWNKVADMNASYNNCALNQKNPFSLVASYTVLHYHIVMLPVFISVGILIMLICVWFSDFNFNTILSSSSCYIYVAKLQYSQTSLIRTSNMRAPPSTGQVN